MQYDNSLTLPIYTLIVCTVFTYFPLIYGYLPILGKLKIVLISGIFMIASYIGSHKAYSNRHAQNTAIFKAWIGFFCILIIGLNFSYDRGQTLNKIITNLKYFLIFFVMVKTLDSPYRLDKIIWYFTACGVGMAISTILNYFIFGNAVQYRAIAIDSGIFGDPNDLALLFNTTLPFSLLFVITAKKKIIPIACSFLIILAIMLTYSRGGFLGLFVCGVGYWVFFGRKNMKATAAVFVAATAFWFFAPEDYKERISTIVEWEVDEETGMTDTRMDAWKSVLQISLKESPLFGLGAGSSIYLAGQGISDWHYVHNSFVQIISEAGLIGFVFYLIFFIVPFKDFSRIRRKRITLLKEDLLRQKILCISFLSFAVTAFFLPQAYSPIIYTLTGMYVAHSELIRKNY